MDSSSYYVVVPLVFVAVGLFWIRKGKPMGWLAFFVGGALAGAVTENPTLAKWSLAGAAVSVFIKIVRLGMKKPAEKECL